jgi:chain length determinant protein EpsF
MLNLSQILFILKARYKAFLVTFFIVFGLVTLVTLMLPKTYTATTSVVLNYKGVDPVTGFAIPSQLMTSYMTTQIGLITSHRVALKVVDKLAIAESAVMKESFQKQTNGIGDIRDWAADAISNNLTVLPSKQSNIIDISYSSKDPQFSKSMADAFAEVYIATNVELANQPSKQASQFLYDQKRLLREQLLEAQSKLAKYQQDNGMTSAIESADIENAKLNELTSQLSAAQSQRIEAENRSRAATNSASSPDIISNPLIQSIKSQISQANTKLAEVSKQYSVNHPKYQSAQAELVNLQEELKKEVAKVQYSVFSTADIYKKREEELKKAVVAQKEKLLDLNRNRDQLSVLQNEVSSAQAAFENINNRISQTDLEGRTNQSDVMMLSHAVLPTSPSSPRVTMNFFFGFFASIFLGLLVVFIKESFNRKVRCIKDIEDVVSLPVIMMISMRTSNQSKIPLLNKVMPKLLSIK